MLLFVNFEPIYWWSVSLEKWNPSETSSEKKTNVSDLHIFLAKAGTKFKESQEKKPHGFMPISNVYLFSIHGVKIAFFL